MDRRDFFQITGLSAIAALVSRTALAAPEAETEDSAVKKLLSRSEVNPADTWDLSSLYPNDDAWETAFIAWGKSLDGYKEFQGHLADGPDTLAKCITFDLDLNRVGDRLAHYADLKTCEDQTNGVYQRMMGRFVRVATQAAEASSFVNPEILAIPSAKIDEFLQAEALAPYKLLLTRIVRFKPHTLGQKEERLLAMQNEMSEAAIKIFGQLTDGDFKFGTVKNEKGQELELSHGNFVAFLCSPDRNVRAARSRPTMPSTRPTSTRWRPRSVRRCRRTFTMPRRGTTRRPSRRPCFRTTCRRRSTTI